MLASLISQYFQESYSVPPPHKEQPSTLKMNKELLCEPKLQSQTMLDSQSSLSFQNQDSYTPFLEHPLVEKSRKEYRNLAVVHVTI